MRTIIIADRPVTYLKPGTYSYFGFTFLDPVVHDHPSFLWSTTEGHEFMTLEGGLDWAEGQADDIAKVIKAYSQGEGVSPRTAGAKKFLIRTATQDQALEVDTEDGRMVVKVNGATVHKTALTPAYMTTKSKDLSAVMEARLIDFFGSYRKALKHAYSEEPAMRHLMLRLLKDRLNLTPRSLDRICAHLGLKHGYEQDVARAVSKLALEELGWRRSSRKSSPACPLDLRGSPSR